MERTKLVTGFYMGIDLENTNGKWIGSSPSKGHRYLGGIIYNCKNLGADVVCYTDSKNYDHVYNIKNTYSLDNLEIKLLELDQVKYHVGVMEVANKTEGPIVHLFGRPPQVMWGKFDMLQRECTDDYDFIYWIDAGLQACQLFPWWANPHRDDEDIQSYSNYKQFNFEKIMNEKFLINLNSIISDRFSILVCSEIQDPYYKFDNIDPVPGEYPIAGFFGGERQSAINFCKDFDLNAGIFLDNNTLCFEQSIMKYVMDRFDNNKLLKLKFDTHQTHIDPDDFHNIPWTQQTHYPKPLYRVFEEIVELN